MVTSCRECSASNEDFARECATCGAALPRICPICATTNEADAAFCYRCGTRVDDASLSRARARSERVRGYLPSDLRERFLAAGREAAGEQRQVTVLFVDLVQSTEIIRAVGDEETADLLDELMGGIAGIVDDLEGTVAEVMGDGALCMFGAPVAHEDDPERALRAALAIRRFVAELDPIRMAGADRRPQVRVGVHTGMVVMRAIGQDYRLTYTAIGDAVHLTQRLQAAAAPGEILISTKTRQLVASLFHFSEPEPFDLKGFARPQVAVRLLGEQDTVQRRVVDGSRAAFVGRDQDLAALQARLDELATGLAGGVLTIWGEAGIGKSRLVAELHRRVPPTVTWLEGRALSYAQNAPYSIIGRQLRRAAGIRVGDTERSARAKLRDLVTRECGPDHALSVYPFIAAALAMRLEESEAALIEGLSGDRLQQQVFRALRTLIGAAARRAPLVLVFEDLHWSDQASTAAIEELLALAEDQPILYVLVARPDTQAPSWALGQRIETSYPHRHTSITLGPLSGEASASLAMNLLEVDSLPSEVRDLVLEKAEGVPLFVEELTSSLVEQGTLTRHGGAWRLGVSAEELRVPDTLQGIILARLDRLEDPLKRVLQIASVVGSVLPYSVLARVSGTNGQLAVRLRDLQRLDLIRETRRRPDAEYAFKHALIRDVAYGTLLTRQRKQLHRRVGEAMESLLGERLGEFQSIIAEHFLRAEAWTRAADLLLRAGDEAARQSADAEARGHYEKAMNALARLPDTVENRRRRVDTTLKQAAVSYVADRPDLNLARLAAAEALAGELPTVATGEDRLRLARVRYWTGRIHHVSGDPARAIGHYRQVLAIGQELGDEQLTAIPSAMIGLALAVQGQWAKASQLLNQAVPALEKAGEWREWCRVVGYLGISVVARGDYHRGVAEAQRALDRAQELHDQAIIGSNHILLCVTHVLNERMETLAAAAQEAVDAAERSGEQVILYAGLAFRGWARGRLGHHPAARRDLEQSNAIGAGLGRLILSDWFAVARADIVLAAGSIDQALALARQAVGVAEQVGSVFTEGLAHRVWAQALAAATPPRWDEAEAHMATSLRALESGEARLPAAHAHLVWGQLCRSRQDTAVALDHLRAAADQFARSQLDEELRQARRLIDAIIDREDQQEP
jgi:class 3 adenylate cyclase/tetratricopeptide (TPR) repeat protein